jgi:hypothetical protein
MSVNKVTGRSGKKTAVPRSVCSKKPPKKGLKAVGSSKSNKKPRKSSASYSSLKARQMTVERLKRSIWASLQKINEAIINNATSGNLAAAKELFNFAGVYSLPTPDDEEAVAAQLAVPASPAATPEPASVHPIDLFFKKLGVEPSTAEPEPEIA